MLAPAKYIGAGFLWAALSAVLQKKSPYVIPENLTKILVGLILGDLRTNKRGGYWIADDGGFCSKSKRVTLAKNSFTLEEVQLSAKTLESKFKLICYINKLRDGFVIIISSKSLPVLPELLKNQMPSMMLYKIGL
jgi:hypothetical protein